VATGATEFIDNTTADAAIPEIWSKKAIVARENCLVLADRFDRQYEDEMDHGDVLHILNVGNLAVRTKSLNTAIVYETETNTNTDLTVSTWEYAAVAIETKTKKQAAVDLMKYYSPKMGYALGLAVDDVLAGRFDDFSQTVGTLGTPTTYTDWLRAHQYLDDANVPQEGRFMWISPAEKANLMEMEQFINKDYERLQDDGKLPKRSDSCLIGHWLGTPVYMSTNVEGSNAAGHDNGLAHKEAVAVVIQQEMKTYTFFDIDYFAHKYAVEILYGAAEIRDDHGVFVQGA
jgi:hypothetical protein